MDVSTWRDACFSLTAPDTNGLWQWLHYAMSVVVGCGFWRGRGQNIEPVMAVLETIVYAMGIFAKGVERTILRNEKSGARRGLVRLQYEGCLWTDLAYCYSQFCRLASRSGIYLKITR